MTTPPNPISAAIAYLGIGGGRAQEAVAWYGRIFGATVNGEGSDEAPALAAGAHTNREPYDGYGRRNAWLVDPFGHRWGLNTRIRDR